MFDFYFTEVVKNKTNQLKNIILNILFTHTGKKKVVGLALLRMLIPALSMISWTVFYFTASVSPSYRDIINNFLMGDFS